MEKELEGVLDGNPVTQSTRKFGMSELLLGDDPLDTFQDLRREVCFSVPNVPGDETYGTFASVMQRFVKHYFLQENSFYVGRKKKYM